MVFVAAAGQAHNGAARILIPVGCAQAGECRHHIAAVGVRHFLSHVFRVAGIVQQAQLVPQPLDGGPGHKDGAFQRILHLTARPAGNGCDQPVLREHRGPAGVHQQKSAGAKGVFRLAGGKAGLAEQGRLLVARRPGNADGAAKVDGIRHGIHAAGRHGRWQHAARDVQDAEDVVIPRQGVDVEHHGAAGVGVIGHMGAAAGQLPDQPGLHRAKQQLPGLGPRPHAGHVVQDPFQLGGREVCVDDQARFLPERLGQPFGFQLVAQGAGAAALPDDGMADRFPRLPIPDDGGLPLVGDADGRDLGRASPDLVHGRKRHAQLGGPDLVRVVLHPAGFGEILGELLLCHTAHPPGLVKQDAAV